MRNRVGLAAAAAVLAGLVPASASAAVVIRTYTFKASNFFLAAATPPVAPVTGSFTIGFDDAANIFDAPGTVTNSLNIPVDSPILFTHETGPFGFVRFGGSQNGSGTLVLGTNDILFQYSLTFGGVLFYSSSSTPSANFFTTDVTVTVTDGISAVPEPSSWAMMLAGFGAIGWGMRRKHRIRTPVPA
jgi:PEP-CTERM motif